jgi:hypothetical protein
MGTTDDPPKFDARHPARYPAARVSAVRADHRVAAVGRAGVAGQNGLRDREAAWAGRVRARHLRAGRFIATADSSLPFNEQTDCPLGEWLAGNGGVQPKILYFGWGPQDGPKQWNVPSDAAGIHLPAQYIGNPGQLLAGLRHRHVPRGLGAVRHGGAERPGDDDAARLYRMGGGMYISSEFYGYLKDFDLVSVNRLLMPLGITSQPVSLNWGNVDGNIDFECFPEPQ